MAMLRDKSFIVVDVETTGGSSSNNRIIDIACIEVQNSEIVAEFTSLVNPHQETPQFIAQMTGISQSMSRNAPEENSVMEIVSDLFIHRDVVFVAHNVSFDFSFVDEALARNGLPRLTNDKLCTLKLAKKILPTDEKKNVGWLADKFGIMLNDRHRAYGDALATAYILIEFLDRIEKDFGFKTWEELIRFYEKPAKKFKYPTDEIADIAKIVDQIPDSPGVFYFNNDDNDPLYIGKAYSMRHRMKTYFQKDGQPSKKIANLLKESKEITWDITDSEVSAIIKAQREIRTIRPKFNDLDLAKGDHPFIVFSKLDDYPHLEISYEPDLDESHVFGPFRSNESANAIIRSIINELKLDVEVNASNNAEINKKEYHDKITKAALILGGESQELINSIERKMLEASSMMLFEDAALLRNKLYDIRKLLENSLKNKELTKRNQIILNPILDGAKTIEYIFLRDGRIMDISLFGRKAPIANILNLVDSIYFFPSDTNHDKLANSKFTFNDIEEYRLLKGWLDKNGSRVLVIDINESDLNEIKNLIVKSQMSLIYGDESFEEIIFE